jgi:predicted type IV restriction endonuclease
MDANAVRLALQQLADTLGTRNPTEDDVEKGFVDVYRALGYATSGRDYRNKSRDVSGVPDVMLHNSDRSIQVIVELKKPTEQLEQHKKQLAEYLLSLREARWGLLSNGHTWRAYQRDGKSVDLVWEMTLADLRSDPQPLSIFERQVIEVTNYKQVAERLNEANREGLTPQGLNDLATEEFLFTFSLK